jgi:hypothetical protein
LAWTISLTATSSARLVATVLTVLAVVVAGVSAEAASISLTWNAPTTNADGSQLNDLAGYRLYLGTSVPSCPGGSFHSVSSPTATPGAGQTVSTRVTALSDSTTYFVRVTAVDTSGNESGCSSAASGVARADLDVIPAASTSFGSVAVGGTVDRTFTVENTGSASLSGAASVGAPFSIVSGASFSLGSGASQTVTVRFRPTSAGSFAGNVTFTAGGDTVSRGVSGSTTGSTAPPPPPPAGPLTMPGSPSVTQIGSDTGGVTFAIAWSAGGGAAAYSYMAAFGDGSAGQQGTVAAPSLQLRMPYHASGAAATGFVCIRSVSATGQQSTDHACGPLPVPARPTGSSVPAAPAVSSLSPASATAGSAALTLTVNGSGFVMSSGVRWNGAARTTTFVSATQLRAAITAADLATARSVSVTVVTPAPGGGTSGAATFTTTPPPPPPAPGAPSVTRTGANSTTVMFTVAWGAVSGATSYRWAAAFNDGSAPRQGTVTTRSFRLQMPYHASGAAAGATVCIRSVNASGQQSTTQACRAVPVPARPVAAPRPSAPPPPPPPGDWGWGTG